MDKHLKIKYNNRIFKADCHQCFGLCCVALPYTKSADFAFHKDGGTPCNNLQEDFSCSIHSTLRKKGFKGCTVYECFGAGQKVSQEIFNGQNWRQHPEITKEMFDVFPKVQQLHEMLYYLNEALCMEAYPYKDEILQIMKDTESLTELDPNSLLDFDIHQHRKIVSNLLQQISKSIRAKESEGNFQINNSSHLLGANLSGMILRGSNFRGALLIACNLRNSDLRMCDFLGADLRDADLSSANLTGSIFLTQAQINSANGNKSTRLPEHLMIPDHWLNS